jgi:nonribosomal peptide synthetase DhbF
LTALIAKKTGSFEKEVIVVGNNLSVDYFLSIQQQGLYLFQQRNPESTAYSSARKIEINEIIDIDYLKKAIKLLFDRHPILNHIFYEESGQIKQKPALGSIEFSYNDLSNMADNNTSVKDDIEVIQQSVAHHVFEMNKGMPIVFHLVSLADDHHLLFFVVHHSVFDGWSAGIMTRDLYELYHALQEGRDPELPSLEWGFKDYIAWQENRMNSYQWHEGLAYWKSRLDGVNPTINLPSNSVAISRGLSNDMENNEYRGARYYFTFSDDQIERLDAFNHRNGFTLFMTLLSVFYIVLNRYSGQKDLCVGTLVYGRGNQTVSSSCV